ncbi:SRPBCC family protein [Desemzia sp. RIT804]|uniref:SRPBCC family protein n=1 Tax=Desemzia sp. RIT 804 TaxID=2810209 RepID=UPI00194DFD5B|nr:SRPBCC family protein [Desemzia sp. RIT 804]MBM6614310.1 SRPBCC family protein [Desemzia sp. RIT 804]
MTATIQQSGDKVIAEFERDIPYEIDLVWRMLTENQYLQKWFSELSVEALEEGGKILFDMRDGTFEEMTITSLSEPNVLEYTWDKDLVRFDLTPSEIGTHLIFKETITEVTDHTPRDITGWHVCLDVIEAILANEELPDTQLVSNELYPVYKEKFAALTEAEK